MKFLNPALLLLLVSSFALWAVGEDNSSTAGQEFRHSQADYRK